MELVGRLSGRHSFGRLRSASDSGCGGLQDSIPDPGVELQK